MIIPWFEYPCRGSGSAPEFSRFSDIKNLQPNQKNNSEPLESINPTTLRDYWTFCRCAVMTKFFALISSFWSLFFLSPRAGQPAPSVSSRMDVEKPRRKWRHFTGYFENGAETWVNSILRIEKHPVNVALHLPCKTHSWNGARCLEEARTST